MDSSQAPTTPGVETISDWIDRQDVYRYGYPHKPLPRPLNDRPLSADDPLCKITEDLYDEINHLLRAHGVDSIQASLASSQWRCDNHKTEPRQTVTLYTHLDQSDSTSWGDLVKAVAGLFQARGFSDTQIEIINPDKTYYAPLLGEHKVSPEIHNHFRAIYDRLILTAKEFIPDHWLAIELGICERQFEASLPTMILYVEEDAACDWDQLVESLKEQIGADVCVRLQPAQLRPTHSTPFPPFPPIPGNGGSISTAGNPDCFGTIGIHVNITVPEGILCPSGLSVGSNNCILTCAHIIAPTIPERTWEETYDEVIRASPNRNSGTKKTVLYPGRGLLRQICSELDQSLTREKAGFETLKDDPEPKSAERQDTIDCHTAVFKAF
ncbi:MAG: hypothetical protein Q9225_006147 [Loekoesia sp. 1 TL-2023]